VGHTFSVGITKEEQKATLAALGEVKKSVALEVMTGKTLGQIEAILLEAGRQAGLRVATDLPLATGLGFDLLEYPASTEDEVRTGMVLQVALAVDVGESFTAMVVDMLQVTPGGGVWLGRSGS
jgi:Xaa-Pro aminopeptidase